MRSLLLRHPGAVFAVLGGGPSLPAQIERLPTDAVRISANDHGARLTPCQYIVCVDNIRERVQGLGAEVIAPHAWADHRVIEQPGYPYSGMHGVWAAWLMGARLVLLAGMDLYRGGTYWHDAQARSCALDRPPDSHLKAWRRVRLPVAIRALGGPLVDVFGEYDPLKAIDYRPTERLELIAACAGRRVQFRRDWTWKGTLYTTHTIAELPHAHAADLLARSVVRLWKD